MGKTPITVVIAEDHAILRAGLRAILSAERGIEIVAEATDGQEAISTARQHKPDLLLMDISMPNLNGNEAIRQVKMRSPNTKVLILTMHRAEEHIRVAMSAGANGYALKDDSKDELLSAISHVAKGNTYLSPAVSGRLLGAYLRGEGSQTSWERLTPRERQTLKLIAEGRKTRQIAEFLSVSPKTVEKHRSNLMRKLDLHSAAAVTSYAIENGLASHP